jgi:hypothetical protein
MNGVIMEGYSRLIASPRVRVVAVAILSALTWFSWAYWANRADPDQALLSGLFQGAVNLLTTAFGSAALELLFVRIGHSSLGRAVSVFIVSSISLLLMVSAHWVADTPNMVLTILPVYAVVLVYCSSYVFGLNKIKKQYEATEVAIQ